MDKNERIKHHTTILDIKSVDKKLAVNYKNIIMTEHERIKFHKTILAFRAGFKAFDKPIKASMHDTLMSMKQHYYEGYNYAAAADGESNIDLLCEEYIKNLHTK